MICCNLDPLCTASVVLHSARGCGFRVRIPDNPENY
jgi:hypothetical protein